MDDMWNSSKAHQSMHSTAANIGIGGGAPAEQAPTDTVQNDLRTVAKAIQVCGRNERRLITADKWKEIAKGLGLVIIPGAVGTAGGSHWSVFRAVFLSIFPDVAQSQMVDAFTNIKQQSVMAAFIPEYKLAGDDEGMEVTIKVVYHLGYSIQ